MRVSLTLCLLLGCSEDPLNPRGQIAPLDGQTKVALDQDLILVAPGLQAPSDASLPDDLIQVIDLEAGGFVTGDLTLDGDTIHFTPAAPWRQGVDYLWTVQQPLPEARRTQVALPTRLLGDATFRAGNGSAVLDAGVNTEGHVCLLLSRRVSHKPLALEVTIDDARRQLAFLD